MGIISRDGYDRKREYAARKMEENMLIGTLTETQHDALAWLCSLRHEMHTNQHHLFLSETAEYSEIWTKYDAINGKLTDCGLDTIELPDGTDIPCDFDCDDDSDFDYEETYGEFVKIMEDINNRIEAYLHDIDKKHGTDYCPTGKSRV